MAGCEREERRHGGREGETSRAREFRCGVRGLATHLATASVRARLRERERERIFLLRLRLDAVAPSAACCKLLPDDELFQGCVRSSKTRPCRIKL